MPGARIIIADSKDNSRKNLRDALQRAGYTVQAEAHSAPDLLRKARRIIPDLVILDDDLEGGSPMEVAGIIEDDNLSSVLVLTDNPDSRRLVEIAHIQKPYTEETLISVIELSILYRNKVISMQNEVDRLKENLSNRKLVEKAKGIIMRNQGLTENEAYRFIQKQSMDHAMSMKEMARKIISAEEN